MTELSNEERRLLLIRLMVRALDDYERGEIGLGQLVSDVESLIDTLFELADSTWVRQLESAWLPMEIVYAVALHEGRTTLTKEDHVDIDKGIAELRALIADRSR